MIHTHPNGNSQLSKIDISALIKLKLDCISAIGVNDQGPAGMSLGFLSIKGDSVESEVLNNLTLEEAANYNVLRKINAIEELIKKYIHWRSMKKGPYSWEQTAKRV